MSIAISDQNDRNHTADNRPVALVTGATGAVGPLIVKAILAKGYRVRTLSLDPPSTEDWPTEVETRLGDVTDTVTVKAAMKNAEVVVHLAALLHIIDPVPALQKKYERVNVGGTANVVETACRSGVKKILYFSTIAVYGPSLGRILSEDTPPQPDTYYAKTKLAAEKIVLEAKDSGGRTIGTVLRLGSVYGARMKGNFQRLVSSLAQGRFIPIGKGLNRRTLIYERDVPRAALLALEHPAARGKVFNVSDGCFHTINEIILTIAQALGKKAPKWSLPLGPIRNLTGLIEAFYLWIDRQPPIRRATLEKYTEDMAVDSQRFRNELGFFPEYDLRRGWREAVQEMRSTGVL